MDVNTGIRVWSQKFEIWLTDIFIAKITCRGLVVRDGGVIMSYHHRYSGLSELIFQNYVGSRSWLCRCKRLRGSWYSSLLELFARHYSLSFSYKPITITLLV